MAAPRRTAAARRRRAGRVGRRRPTGMDGVDVRFLGFVPGRRPAGAVRRGRPCSPTRASRRASGCPSPRRWPRARPVVTSAGTSTEEVAGGAAVLVDPFDVDAIAAGIDEAQRRAAELAAAGRARAAELTWDAAAERTLAVYREAVGGRAMSGAARPSASTCCGACPAASAGSEEYLVRQLTGLRDAAPEIRARLFVLPGFAAAHRELAARHELVVASLDARRRSRRIVSEATWLPRRLAGVDVVHHGGGTVPPRSPGPVAAHDPRPPVPHATPSTSPPSSGSTCACAIPRSVKRADVVAVPSEYVRGTVIEAFGRDPDRVVVVPHGVDVPGRAHAGRRAARALRPRRPARTSCTRRSPTRTRTTASCSTCSPDRGTTRDLALVLLGGRGPRRGRRRGGDRPLGLGGRVVRPGTGARTPTATG